jgi:adenylate cyclase
MVMVGGRLVSDVRAHRGPALRCQRRAEFLTAAYAHKGDMARAAAAKERLLTTRPGFTLSWIKSYAALQHPLWQEQFETHVIAGLRKAGVPEK